MKRTTSLFILIVAIVLCSCQAGVAAPQQSQEVSGVVISFAARPDLEATFTPLIEAFNSQNSDVQVRFVGLTEGTANGSQFLSLARAADTAFTDDQVYSSDVLSGAVTNLMPFVTADSSFDQTDYFPGLLERFGGNEQLYMLPYAVSIPRLAYNKTLFAQAGISTPNDNWSWSDVVAAADQLVKRMPDKVSYGVVDDGLIFGTDLMQSGLKSWEADQNTVRLDQPPIAEAFERSYTLARQQVVYDPWLPNAPNPQSLIEEGKVGMWRAELLASTSNNENASPDIGYVALPKASYYSASVTRQVQAFMMSAGTQHPNEAWRWLSFLSRQTLPVMYMYPDEAPTPARHSVLQESGYLNKLSEEVRRIVQHTLDQPLHIIPLGEERQSFLIGEALSQAKSAIFQQDVAPDVALREAQQALLGLIAQATPIPTAEPFVVPTPMPLSDPPGVTSIRFSTGALVTEHVQAAARAFETTHPDMRIRIITTSTNTIATEAQHVDCFSGIGNTLPPGSGLLLDLQPLIDADATFNRADYPEVLLNTYQQNSQTFGIPGAAYLRVVLYNKDLFTQAGLNVPQPEWTLDQFLQAAQQLTKVKAGAVAGFVDYEPRLTIPFFLGQYGTSWVRYDQERLRPNFDAPAVIAGTRYYLDLQQTGRVLDDQKQDGLSLQQERALEALQNGQAGMLLSTTAGDIPQDSTTVGIAPPPLGTQGATATDVFSIGLFISARTQHADVCWQWLKFLSGRGDVLPPGAVPARMSVAQSLPATALTSLYVAYLPALRRERYQPDQAMLSGRLDIDFYWYFAAITATSDQQSLDERLRDAQTKTQSLFDCVDNGVLPETCVKQIDPQRVTN